MQPSDPNLDTDINSIWNTFTCTANTVYLWQNGTLKIWLKQTNDDWLIASKTVSEQESSIRWEKLEKEPEPLEWNRWILNDALDSITLSPTMPDRPLVVKTLITSHLPPGTKATFYISLPLAAQISSITEKKETKLAQMNSLPLSNTWFGDNFSGEICYAFKTRAVREHQDATQAPYRAVCPVTIHNDATVALPIQKICVRVKNLNLYKGTQFFWTNQVKVTFRGDQLPSRVDYKTSAPTELENAVLFKKADEEPENKFLSTLGHSFLNIF